MDIDDLRTFLLIAEGRSLSAVADQIHLSQPAVTRRIKRLEEQLDSPLFDRVGKRMLPTAAGRALIPGARQVLQQWTDTQRELSNLKANVSGPLTIGTSHHIGLHRLAPVLRHFRARFPTVALNIQFEDSEVTHQMVSDGQIELAIATLNPAGSDHLTTQAVWNDPLVFVDRSARSASLEELSQLPCVLPGEATYTGRIVTEEFKMRGLTLKPTMSTNYLETIEMMVGVGLGWSVLPRTLTKSLHIINLNEGLELQRSLGLITHPERVRTNAAQAFIDTLMDYADV